MTIVSEEKQETCALCCRLFPADELVWSGCRQAFVCPGCLAEDENCCCADE